MKFRDFYRGKKVLVTGHNGFKGTWLTQWLIEMGADVYGVSLSNELEYSLFDILDCKSKVINGEFDIRDYEKLSSFFKTSRPEIVFHLAAQPIVLESYNNPLYTHQVNYLGTLNLLESIRNVNSVKTVIIVTSDKVYKPKETGLPLSESDVLGGIDPYSASKSATEILVDSYRKSYFTKLGIKIYTARAGNVIGIGDWGKNRLIPDLFRSILNGETLEIRNPSSVRPWQNVNDLIYGYLLLAYKSHDVSLENTNSFNFGPNNHQISVIDIINYSLDYFEELKISVVNSDIVETKILVLNSNLAKELLKWESRKDIVETLEELFLQFKFIQNNKIDLLIENIQKSIHLKLDGYEN